MKKNYLFLLLAVICFAGKSSAQVVQPCGTDEMRKKYVREKPEILVIEKQLEEQIQNYTYGRDMSRFARKTSTTAHSDTDYYDIPLVIHVTHNYGSEYLTDNKIYELVAEMNRFYNLQYNYSAVIQPFKKYVAKAKFRFHLAKSDPNGNPTNGITRHRTYLTYGYDDQAKIDQWPQSSYVNIWFEYRIGAKIPNGIIVAYATQPPTAAGFPPYDGIICNYSFINDAGTSNTQGGSIDHEMGHIMNLFHTFGHSNNPHTNKSGDCGDDDGVDDTPPTEGNLGGCSLWDTVCAQNYYKIYTDIHGNDSLVNYPDTSNEQNIMNYADCKNMFTQGQVVRMRAAINSTVGFRSNLWDSTNLAITGVGTFSPANNTFTAFPNVDLKPVPEFSALPSTASASGTNDLNYMDRVCYFTFPGSDIKFVNESWNDTVTSLTWNFSNTASTPTVTQANPVMGTSAVTNHFTDPGWVTLSMTATGNNSGDATATWNRAVFVADNAGQPGVGYFQEFSGPDTAKWPMFNYYNNNLKWQYANVGYWDNNSVEYVGYDDRILTFTGNPRGDFDDFFSIPMDLSSSQYGSGPCSMNFYYSGASRTSNSLNITDTLLIQYSTGNPNVWTPFAVLAKGTLCNRGALATPYTPTSPDDWQLFSQNVPAAARTANTVFRFRYKPGTSLEYDFGTMTYVPGTQSSGNNFFMDRITFSPYPAGVHDLNMGKVDVAVMPNPTSGNAYVIIKDADNTSAAITVSDITGKVVYRANHQLSGNETTIEVPQSAISVSGMYLVHVATGNQVRTMKLVVQ